MWTSRDSVTGAGGSSWLSRGALSKLWGLFLDTTVGYGHRPWQAGVWLIALVAIGGLLFGEAYQATENEHRVRHFELYPTRDADQVPPFQPIVYTVDVLVPVISLGQRVAWNASGAAQWATFILTICGWLLTTTLIAGLAARRL